MHLISAIVALFRKPVVAIEEEFVSVPVMPAYRDRWCDPYAIAIRRAAINRHRGEQRQADYDKLRDLQTTWLQLLGKPALMKVATATDDAIYDHLHGKRAIRGVLAADRESVAAEKARRKRASFSQIVREGDGRRGSGGGPARSVGEVEAEFQQLFEEIMTPAPGGPRR